jgi:3-oxoacyl-[acyl-carrier-protein] synthase-3
MNAPAPTPASSLSRFSRIAGTGGYLPRNRVTNAQLADRLAATGVETSDDWITERTGIKSRHFAHDDELCSDLAVAAARLAIEAAGVGHHPIAAAPRARERLGVRISCQ